MPEYTRFIAAKERIWEENGYGPWAFVLDDEFVGWGGIQPEGDDVDVGLVLRRTYWGAGKVLYMRMIDYAFGELRVDSVIALLPASRTRVTGLRRLGFREDGEVMVGEEIFSRFRLTREARQWQPGLRLARSLPNQRMQGASRAAPRRGMVAADL